MKFVPVATSVLLAVACAYAATATSGSRNDKPVLMRDQLPSGFAISDGKSPFGLAVKANGSQLESVPATDLPAATITLTRSSEDDGTSIKVKSSLNLMIKYDLYISPDGKRFVYTSTCPLVPNGSGFEMWPHPIHSFAFGNPRVISEDQMSCE